MSERPDTGVKAVHLAFDVLEAVAAEPGDVGVSELALRLGTTKGTVFRHLQTLVDRGYLAQNPATARYRLGVRAHLLGQATSGRIDLLAAAEGPMRALREAVGTTVVISAISARGVTVLATVLGKSALEIGVRPGSDLALHSTAQGRVAAAFGPAALRQKLLRSDLPGRTLLTRRDRPGLEAALDQCRAAGYATAPEEEMLGINALAMPLFGDADQAVGALALVGSIQHVPALPDSAQIAALRRAAIEISQVLGFRGDYPVKAPA